MPIARFEMPDGRIGRFEVPEGTSPEQAQRLIASSLAAPSPQQDETPKRKGIGAGLSKGLASLISSGQTTLESPFGVNRAAERSLERSEALGKKYEDQIGLDKLREVYEKRGLVSAGGELLRQVPLALAEQAPNIVSSLASARLGATAGAAFGPYGVIGGGILGAVAPSAIQLFGSNVERQAAEQKEAGKPTDISTSKALAATAIQAPLDAAATFIPLGGKIAGKIFGPEVEKILMRGGTKAAEKLAQESFAKTLGKGLGIGALAEIPTEVAQQVLERAQAGLSLTSPEALKEYGETAYQSGLLAPIGGAGRFVSKFDAKSKMALEQKQKDDALAQEQQAAAQEAQLAQQAEEQQKQLQAQQVKTGDLFGEPVVTGVTGKKLVEGAVSPLTSKPELFETGLNEKNEPTYGVRQAVPETRTAVERENQQKEQQQQTEQLFAADFDAKQKVERLEKELIAAAQKGDLDTITKIQPVLKQYRDQIKTLGEQIKKAAPIEERSDVQMSTYRGQLKKKMAELAKFAESDPEKVDKLVPEIKELQNKIEKLLKSGTQFDMFEPEKLAADKKERIAEENEQLQQQQEDLFAQVESTKPKTTEVVTDRYQQGLQELEDAYAAGASERIINNLIGKLREASLEKEASKARGISGEEVENQEQRVERVKRALEEAKEQYDSAKKPEDKAEALKNVNALQDRLATAQADRAQGRPEVAEKEAFGKQEEAKRDAVETVRQILSGEYFNSKNVDVASSLKPQLENKIVDAGKQYGREAVNEINAVREQYKQSSLSTDDALKLVTRLQGRFSYLAKNPTYLAEKVREANLKTFEDSLERIKQDFFKGESKIQKAPTDFALENDQKLPKALRIKALEEQIKNVKPGGNTKVAAQLTKVENELAELDKEPPSKENAAKVTALKKEQLELKTRLGRYLESVGEKSRKQTIEDLKAKLEKVKAEPDIVEEQEPIKPSIREANTLTVREKEAGIKETPDVTYEQPSLFTVKELEPLAVVRATSKNFITLLNSESIRKVRNSLNIAENNAKNILAKKDFVSPNAEKVKQLEALRLKIENETKKQPPLYKPTEADKKRLPAAKIKQEVERTRRNFLKYKINLEKLEEQEKKLAEEIKGSENFDSLLDNLRKQREFVNDLMDPEEAVKILKANAEDLFNQRKNLLKSIDDIKKDMQKAYQGTAVSADIAKTKKALEKEKNVEQRNSLNKFLASLLKKKEDKDDILAHHRSRLKEAENTLKELDGADPTSRAKTLSVIDGLYERVNRVLKANVEAEVAILNSLEKQYAKTQKTNPEAAALALKLEEERKKTAVSSAKALNRIEKNAGAQRAMEQERKEVLQNLPYTSRTTEVARKEVTVKKEGREFEEKAVVLSEEQVEKLKKVKAEIRALEKSMESVAKNTTTYRSYAKDLEILKDRRDALKEPPRIQVIKNKVVGRQIRIEELQKTKNEIAQKQAQFDKLTGKSPNYKKVKNELDVLQEYYKTLNAGEVAQARELIETRKQLGTQSVANKNDVMADTKDYIKALEERRQKNIKDLKALGKRQEVVPEDNESQKDFRDRLEIYDTSVEGKKTIIQAIEKEIIQQKEKVKELTEAAKAEKTLAALGNAPERTERKKLLKTGERKYTKSELALLKETSDIRSSVEKTRFSEDIRKESGLDKDIYVDMFNDIRNGDVDFRIEDVDSNAPPITKAEAEDVLSKIKMPKGLKVFVLDKIPADLKDLFESMGHKSDKIKGWVSSKGDVYIVAENHTSIPDLNETIAHELIGHVGVEALLGEQGMRSLIRKIVSQEGGVLELAKKLGVIDEVYGTYASAKRQGLSDYEAQAAAVRELIAHTAEKAPNRSMTQKFKEFIKVVVAHVRDALRKRGVKLDTSTSDIYKIIHKARTNFENITPGAFVNADGAIKFRSAPAKATPAFESVLNSTNGIVAQQKSLRDKAKAFLVGFETAYIDRFAPIQKVLEPIKDSLKATQLMYYLRMHDQRMAFTSEVLSNGPIDVVPAKDGKGFIIESKKGTSFIDVVEALKPANVGDVNATNRVFTLYLLAKRAAEVGLNKLNYSGKITQEMLDNAINTVNSDPATKAAFENAAAIYAKYNEGLINFAVKAGAINKADAAAMLKNKNYVPFYRVRDDGAVLLEIGGAPPVKIGNLADQPYLHELVGGDQPIFDVFTSALQNTSMLTDMALRNIAAKNTANTLADLGLLKVGEGKKDNGIYKGGDDVTGTDIIRFKYDGENYYARVNSEAAGVPTQLLVKGLEGINTSLPEIVKTLNVPSTILRKWVTRNPAYVLRQLVRDPLNGVVTAGLDTVPIVSSMKEISKMFRGKSEGEALLQGRGILGGQVLTGTIEDQQAMLKSLLSGGKGWDYRMAQLDQLSIKGDAATRVVMYNNYIKQGLSEMEATLATLESMNFSKRGISASLFQISTMVPFMNAQIQGLNVLWKSFSGKMPFDQKLKIKQKAIQRSLMLMGSTILYAAMMQDDEAYQNANDDEKYGNWFVYTPFSDEPVKVPIPFEVGLLFKAVPEALVNTMFGDAKARDTVSAIGKQAMNSLPSVFPQAIKPALETAINYSFYTGRGIESDRLMQYEPGERYEDRTSELAKFVGGALNISPVKMEYLIKGYFGSIPLAVASMANPIIRSGESGEKPESRGMLSSDTPLLGTFFQPVDAGGLINKAYKDMDEITTMTQTYKKMVKENRLSEAEAYLDMNADVIAMGSMAGRFRKQMGDLTNLERAIRSDPDMSAGEKRKELDEIKQLKIETAKYFSSVRG
jgi:hypothetical protein